MRVIILSKAPIVGKVKTRLQPIYTAEQAAKLHQCMLEAVVAKVCSVFNDVWLAADDINHHCFRSLQQRFSVKLVPQGSGDLGCRMNRLMLSSFGQDSEPLMFLGTDSPHVGLQRYKDAEKVLSCSDVVVGAVEDGGYDLIGLRRPHSELFDGIHWGSETVFKETMNSISKLGLKVNVLEVSFDLDRPQDLERAPPESW